MRMFLKKCVVLLLSCLLITSVLEPVSANQQGESSPRYTVPITGSVSANINASDVLYVTANYVVNDSPVTDVTVRTYVEKRSLLVIWTRVDIGETNNEWVDYGGTGTFNVSHTAQLSNAGTYRVTTIFEVYNGSVLLDTIEKTQTVSC